MQIRSIFSSLLIIACLTNLFFGNNANAQSVLWAKYQVGSSMVYGNCTASDKFGNVYVAGHFFGPSVSFGSITIANSNSGFADMYLVKYDPLGNPVWARSAGGNNSDSGTGLTTDEDGNVILTGWFISSSITFGTKTLTNTKQYFFDMFLVKYDASGNVLWAFSNGGDNDDKAYGITTDKIGNIYITGTYKSASLTFGSSTILNIAPGFEDAFVVKFDGTGKVIRANSYGGLYIDGGFSLSTDDEYNLYMSGTFLSASISFGLFTLFNEGVSDIFIVKFDSSGTEHWAKGYGSTNYDVGSAIRPDKYHNIYVSGYFKSPTIAFAKDTLINTLTNTAEAYLLKLDYKGNEIWARSAKGNGEEYGNGLVVDSNGNAFLSGSFNSPVLTLGTMTLQNKGSDDMYISKFDTAGNVTWVKSAGGTQYDGVSSAAIDRNNNIFLAGSFSSASVPMGKDTLSSLGNLQMFVSKIVPATNNNGVSNSSFKEKDITVFPNPSRGNLTVSLPVRIEKGEVYIYTVLGERIFSEPWYGSSEMHIDLNKVAKGIYFVNVLDGEKQYIKKIILQ